MNKKTAFPGAVELALHILTWTYIFVSPLLFNIMGDEINWTRYAQRMVFPMTLCIIFYVNYLWLVPQFFLRRRYTVFFLANALLFVTLTFGRECLVEMIKTINTSREDFKPRMPRGKPRMVLPGWYFHFQTFVMYAFVTTLAVVVSQSKQWKKAEKARQQAELERKNAQLQNLRNQINPHFLLNTLNNIYSLTTFDTEKAQCAILQLSKLLRYMLYENLTPFVPIEKEVDFLRQYVDLMRLRLPEHVKVSFTADVKSGEEIVVAPLIFISLVENAFKHGVCPNKDSFITISLKADGKSIEFATLNSNHPKTADDKAGSGIGLPQTHSRLQLSYPGSFTWNYGQSADGSTYSSVIIIKGR